MTLMAFLGWFGLVALAHMVRTALAAPPPEPRPNCADCGARFLDPRGVDAHRRAAHPDVFEDRAVVPVAYRQEDR